MVPGAITVKLKDGVVSKERTWSNCGDLGGGKMKRDYWPMWPTLVADFS